jgi:hypothetical protein
MRDSLTGLFKHYGEHDRHGQLWDPQPLHQKPLPQSLAIRESEMRGIGFTNQSLGFCKTKLTTPSGIPSEDQLCGHVHLSRAFALFGRLPPANNVSNPGAADTGLSVGTFP